MNTEIENVSGSSEGSVPHVPRAFVAYTAAPQVERLMEEYLGEQAKVLMPEKHRETFVKLAPWFALVFLPIHFAAVMLLFGVTALATLVGHVSWGGALLSGAILVCKAIALPGLFKRSRHGWAFLAYAECVALLSEVFRGSLFGAATTVLVLWILFQVKSRYS